ncbi:MAG: hypothetical protein GX605_07165, partial [Chloroflexi bacterium]|nr:hypothetical protein [Chloroflexota bacterium]
GEEDKLPRGQSGREWFEGQPDDVQQRMMGQAKWQAWKAGEFGLGDLVERHESAVWGPSIGVKSLERVLAEAPPVLGASLRGEARLVGTLGAHLDAVVGDRTTAREVLAAPETERHYRERHEGQFDMAKAEALIPSVLASPRFVYQGKKASTLVFVGDYAPDRYLLVPVKALPGALWLESVYVDSKSKFHRRGWTKKGPLYQGGE